MALTIIDPTSGWREGAKRVLVVATDACYHYANDSALKVLINYFHISLLYSLCSDLFLTNFLFFF